VAPRRRTIREAEQVPTAVSITTVSQPSDSRGDTRLKGHVYLLLGNHAILGRHSLRYLKGLHHEVATRERQRTAAMDSADRLR
jgi:hypothetical protein